jgi:tetratricopeptide (TPR) repeat protein
MTRELGTRKLISTRHQGGQEILSLHRLLQSKIIQELDRDPKRRGEVFMQSFTMVRKRLPRPNPTQMPDASKWEVYKENLQHVLNLRRQFDEALDKKPQVSGSLELAQLFYDAAFNCWERQSSQDGMLLLDTAERILDDLKYDQNARIRAHILAIGALVRDNIGISKKREGLMKREKALEIRQWIVDHIKPVSRTDEILLYNAMSDLAESHLHNYDHSKASALIQQCRDKYEEWGTEEEYPFEFSKYYHNMAAVMVLQRRFDEAIKLCERALDLTEKVHPVGQGPRWIEFRYNLACYLLQAGDKQGSLKMHKDVKRRREELTGESSYVSLQSCYTIGSIYHHLGDLATAE